MSNKELIPWERMDEIASKAIDKLFQMDSEEAREFLEEEVEITDEEKNYFCIDQFFEDEDEPRNWTPCDEADEDGHHHCPYEESYTGYADEMCRVCCGLGVDE